MEKIIQTDFRSGGDISQWWQMLGDMEKESGQGQAEKATTLISTHLEEEIRSISTKMEKETASSEEGDRMKKSMLSTEICCKEVEINI